ncbi:crotonase/enoyl-CoA hydratase family protein [Pseudomonas aeruginosa]
MSELISYQFEDGIATLTLNNGKVNAISPAVIDAFNQALDQALQDKAVVIVTGQPGILSGGYDLKVMTSGPENAVNLVAAGSTLARRLLSHPYPVIVACPGHAVAKGAFLLLSADYRIGVDGPFQIGLNEVAIDLIISNILLAMGMMMVSPMTISLPFKLLLFVLLDGWARLTHGLVISYGG